jgi:hypothetical protein
MGLLENTLPQELRAFRARQRVKRTKGKPDVEIQAAVSEAARVGSPAEATLRTLERMRLADAKIAQFMGVAYPYPTPA